MITKNEEFIGIVERLGSNGEGIVKNGDCVVFVSNALPSEKIRYKILKATKNYAFGKLLEVLVPADERVRPVCPVFEKCGGCQLQHLKYPVSLKFKSTLVADCFKKIANLDVKVSPTVKSQMEYGYRNKLQLPVSSVDGETVIGFYAENSHRIIPINECFLHPNWSEKLILALKTYMRQNKILGFNETLKIGTIRHIVCREVGGKFIITLVVVKNDLPNLDAFISLLKESFANFSLFININDKDTNVVFGDEFRLVYGEPTYKSEFLGVKFNVGVLSFMQVNTTIASKIYQNVVKTVSSDENVCVIDAYSGTGLMTAMMAKRVKKAYGIEIVEEAVEISNKLAKDNGLTDKMFSYLGDVKDVLPSIVNEINNAGDKAIVVLDPPRKGCDEKVLNTLINSNISEIVYVSCNPATLARDIGILVGSVYYDGKELKKAINFTPRYEIVNIKPYDMFPQTKHVETVVHLKRI
ncbi:MAG: 23S rRNA (uracil(1939)-C(5))-methyltransferase RlmD [Clostridia bacterium]|nr:23S rRNA (uracil(1939)-C(5))-methyltransferase RlmD [Clostridia bacterium]